MPGVGARLIESLRLELIDCCSLRRLLPLTYKRNCCIDLRYGLIAQSVADRFQPFSQSREVGYLHPKTGFLRVDILSLQLRNGCLQPIETFSFFRGDLSQFPKNAQVRL